MFKYEFWVFCSGYKHYHEYRTYKVEKTKVQLSEISKQFANKITEKRNIKTVSCGYRCTNNNKYYFVGGKPVYGT